VRHFGALGAALQGCREQKRHELREFHRFEKHGFAAADQILNPGAASLQFKPFIRQVSLWN
jgi:hypothetical protein